MIKAGSIIEILNHDAEFMDPDYGGPYFIGSRWEVLAFHQETGEVEVCAALHRSNPGKWVTFFPGEYKLVE